MKISTRRQKHVKWSVFGLILNACPGSFVVSDFLPPRRFKQIGAIVVSLQNLPEVEKIAPKWSCLCVVVDGHFCGQLSGTEKSSVPPILCSRPPERGYLKNLGFVKRPWQWHPTPVLLPGKFHGRRTLVGCSPWGR